MRFVFVDFNMIYMMKLEKKLQIFKEFQSKIGLGFTIIVIYTFLISIWTVAKLEDMLVMHCMTNAVLECHFYLKILSKNWSAKRSPLYNNKVYSKKPYNFALTDDFS